jgi:D-serine deaminase-like pyridoxal phosphate-dependent protein
MLEPFLGSLRTAAQTIRDESLFDTAAPVVSAGGSSYPDVVVDVLGPRRFAFPVRVVLRSGCYVTHDHGMYERTSPFGSRAGSGAPRLRPALELVASVWSRPEDELVIAGFGRRDVPTDDVLPVVLGRYDSAGEPAEAVGYTVTGVNDQHAFVRVPATTSAGPGDQLILGVSHPCGAFDRWRSVVVVDETYSVVGTVTTAL